LFENQYADIYSLNPHEVLLHLCPLVKVVKENVRQDLWLQSCITGEYIFIKNASEFSIMGFLMEKDQFGYVLHKCKPSSTETNPRTVRQIGEAFEQCFSNLVSITTVFREKKLYSSLGQGDSAAATATITTEDVISGCPCNARRGGCGNGNCVAGCNCQNGRRSGCSGSTQAAPSLTRNFNVNTPAAAPAKSESSSSHTHSSRAADRSEDESDGQDDDEELF